MVQKLSLKETQYLIANKPLALVNLEHSDHNKKVVVKALTDLWHDPAGSATFSVLQEFLGHVAPNYNLSPKQDGVRHFLLREMSRISQRGTKTTGGFLSDIATKFKMAMA